MPPQPSPILLGTAEQSCPDCSAQLLFAINPKTLTLMYAECPHCDQQFNVISKQILHFEPIEEPPSEPSLP